MRGGGEAPAHLAGKTLKEIADARGQSCALALIEVSLEHGLDVAFLSANGVVINRPPRDGRMAFVRSPDLISIELLQKGGALPPQEPWLSMPNTGIW